MQQTQACYKKHYQANNRCSKQCSHHRFSLENQDYPPLNCQVAFCPKYHKSKNSQENTFPVFINDRKFYTSAFIVEVDRKALESSQHVEYQEYQRKILKLSNEGLVTFPKTSKISKFCMVCRVDFEDYFEHIAGQQHKLQLGKNDFTKQIESLSQKFRSLHPVLPNYTSSQTAFTKNSPINDIIQDAEDPNHQQLRSQATASEQSDKTQQQEDTMQRALFSSSDEDSQEDRKHDQQPQEAYETLKNYESQDQQQSDKVEIVAVKPPKVPRNTLKTQYKSTKAKKILKNNNKNKKKNKNKPKKQKKSKDKAKKTKGERKKKKKKQTKSKKSSKDRQQSQQKSEIRKKSIKRRPLDPPPASPPLIHKKMALRVGIKAVHPPQSTTEVVLIEKSQIQDAQIDKSYEKILQNIVATINKGPPAEAPRQYRKIVNPIDARITTSTRITQNYNSTINCQSRTGPRQGLSSQQSHNNDQNMSLRSDRSANIIVGKSGFRTITQGQQTSLTRIPQKNSIDTMLHFQKLVEKPDWEKLKQNVLSSIDKQTYTIQKPKSIVISLEDQEKQHIKILPSQSKPQFMSESLNSIDNKAQIKANLFSKNQRRLINGIFSQAGKATMSKSHQQKQPAPLSFLRKPNQLERQNEIMKHLGKHNQLSLSKGIVSHNSKQIPNQLNIAQLNTSLGKSFKPESYRNPHLTRKFSDNNFREQATTGVIDLQMEEIEQTQKKLCNRLSNEATKQLFNDSEA